ncbi:MAG TPA: ABC transporter ATP-binding protein [Xanthobacteraceae bacterium]|jgi:peptide/nickel transport system ATP-binding protein
MTAPLLQIDNLEVTFHGDAGRVTRAVGGVSLGVGRGRTLGVVGESGSGKSVTFLAVMGLLPQRTAQVAGGIRFDGRDLLTLPDRELRDLRGNRLAMIFQEPMTSLNPSLTIGEQIIEVFVRHRGLARDKARRAAIEMLRLVRIPSPEQRVDDYPHRLSGGMRQRAMIAIALACRPQLIIADEPTTALDVTIQAQILDLLRDLKSATDAAIVLITHDLGVIAEVADDVAVMYAGEVVEQAPVATLFTAPEHPYTVGLLGSLPRLDQKADQLAVIDGMVPDMSVPQPGCRFAPRCPFADAGCRAAPPPVVQISAGHWSRCFKTPLAQLVA